MINQNRSLVEPFATTAINVFQRFNADIGINTVLFKQEGNDEIEEALSCEQNSNSEDKMEAKVRSFPGGADIGSSQLPLSDSVINENIRCLNKKQREVFDVILKWSKDQVKYSSTKKPKEVHPFYGFLTGGGGVGKSRHKNYIYVCYQESDA